MKIGIDMNLGKGWIGLLTANTLPAFAGERVKDALRDCAYDIEMGALVTIEVDRFRVRPLPIRPASRKSVPHG